MITLKESNEDEDEEELVDDEDCMDIHECLIIDLSVAISCCILSRNGCCYLLPLYDHLYSFGCLCFECFVKLLYIPCLPLDLNFILNVLLRMTSYKIVKIENYLFIVFSLLNRLIKTNMILSDDTKKSRAFPFQCGKAS